jgi:hypothetical protein
MATERRAGRGLDARDSWTATSGQFARWVALDLDLRAPRTWFGPSWALLGGVVSSGNMPLELRSLVILAVAWLACEPVLGTLLAQSLEMSRSRRERGGEAAPKGQWSMPYAQPQSPGQRAVDGLAARLARLTSGWQATEGAPERWLVLALVAVVLGAVVGGAVPLLVTVALAVLLYVTLSKPLRRDAREGLAAGQFFLAWLIGRSAFAALDYRSVLMGAAFAGIWYAWTRRPPQPVALTVTHVLLAALLAIAHAPLSAGGVLLLAGPVLVLLPEGPSNQRTYLPQSQLYLMASLLLAAWGSVWSF